MKRVISIALILLAPSCYALQEKVVCADSEVEGFISNKELNRIKVSNDRIRAIRANAGELEILEDKHLGDIYVRALTNKAINLFVSTEKGYTYKLNLLPKKASAEQIVLTNTELLPKPKAEEVQSEGAF